jgi:hypothetical protein
MQLHASTQDAVDQRRRKEERAHEELRAFCDERCTARGLDRIDPGVLVRGSVSQRHLELRSLDAARKRNE